MSLTPTIAAIATPYGTGGIAIIRLSGPEALAVASRLFRARNGKSLSFLRGYSGALGDVFDCESAVDEAIAFVYRAPRSYTGEDVVELSCHGGAWLAGHILRLCLKHGAIPAAPGEFTKRAFLNSKMELTQAEAVMDMIGAEGAAALNAAAAAHSGAIAGAVRNIAGKLLAEASHLAAWSDFPEEGLEEVDTASLAEALNAISGELSALLSTYDQGKILREGVVTAIAGKPNVGKSTLMNLLAGYERSIVTDIPGTTRDMVSESVRLGDIVLKLTDTAGIRPTDDLIEHAGIRLAREQLERAQLVFAVFDYAELLDQNDRELLETLRGRRWIAVVNKTDLVPKLDIDEIRCYTEYIVMVSAKNGEGVPQLRRTVEELLSFSRPDTGAPVIANERQRACLEAASRSVKEALHTLAGGITLDAVNICLDEALAELLSLTGENVSERIIDEVFSRFCVGK